jgi:hypothetical protein
VLHRSEEREFGEFITKPLVSDYADKVWMKAVS